MPNDLLVGGVFMPPDVFVTQLNLALYFERGCLTGLPIYDREFVRHAAAFAGREPLIGVELLATAGPEGEDLAGCPHLPRVGTLRGYHPDAVYRSPHLTGLRAVTQCEPASVPTLAAGPAAAGVHRLWVDAGWTHRAYDPQELARALADTPAFAGLRRLELYETNLATADYRRLIASPHLSPDLAIRLEGRGRVRTGSAVARDLATRFQGRVPGLP